MVKNQYLIHEEVLHTNKINLKIQKINGQEILCKKIYTNDF